MNDEKRGRSELARRAELEWINNLHSVYCCSARPSAGLSGSSAVHSVQLLQSADHQIISRYLAPEIERSPSPSVTVATMEHHYTSSACCLSADSVCMGRIVKLM